MSLILLASESESLLSLKASLVFDNTSFNLYSSAFLSLSARCVIDSFFICLRNKNTKPMSINDNTLMLTRANNVTCFSR